MKQTAVEWLYNNIDDIISDGLRERVELLKNEAKEIEKQQIIDAYEDGKKEKTFLFGKQYYSETFK